MTAKRKTKSGAKLILIPDASTQLVFVDLAFKVGSVLDPPGKSGLASLTTSMLLRGTKRKSAKEFHEQLDELGADIYLGKYMESIRIVGEVLVENLDPFFDLLCEMVSEPAFSEEEFQKLLAQTRSSLQDELGSDGGIAERRFQEYLLEGHPYGRITSGSLASIARISVADLRRFYEENLCVEAAVFAATGNFKKEKMEGLARRLLDGLPSRDFTRSEVKAPHFPPGRRLLIVEKPDRTQSQIYIGGAGAGYLNPDYYALLIGNHVFGGGSFSAWLMKEVREKRGWAYGAYASFRTAREPLYFMMTTTPSNKDTAPAVLLMLELFEKFAKKGVTKAEFDFAKKSLVNQTAFQQDTPKKRLNNKVSEELLGLPAGFYDRFQGNLRKVTYGNVQSAIRRQFRPEDLFVMVLGTSASWAEGLRQIPGLRETRQVDFNVDPT